jgi:hypothetical protein
MGLLDDAIREHLELKRQHGADPEEVSRQEREALGATRKAEFAKTADTDEERPEVEAEAGVADPEAEAPVEEPVAAAEPEADLEPEPEPGGAPFDAEAIDPPRDSEAAEAGDEEDPWLADERDEVPADDSLEHPRAPEVEQPGEDAEESDDVLEETPDFLQETPEHDRLWFEQRPPRDFDWDK